MPGRYPCQQNAVCSGKRIRLSWPASSNRHRSTASATSENTAKFVPCPCHVAPRGNGSPGRMTTGVAGALRAAEGARELLMSALRSKSQTPKSRIPNANRNPNWKLEPQLGCWDLGFGISCLLLLDSVSALSEHRQQSLGADDVR